MNFTSLSYSQFTIIASLLIALAIIQFYFFNAQKYGLGKYNMPLVLSSVTNQKSVPIFIGDGERDKVLLGIKFLLMYDERWGTMIGELIDEDGQTSDAANEGSEEKRPKRKFIESLRANKKALFKVCKEVVVLSESGLQINLEVADVDGDGNSQIDEFGETMTRMVAADLKKGDKLEGDALVAFFSFVATVQQVVDYYSKHVVNVHQRDKKK